MDDARKRWLAPDELDTVEHRARYATDEVEIHALARQTLLRLIDEVRWCRQQALTSDGTAPALSLRDRRERARSERPAMPWRTSA